MEITWGKSIAKLKFNSIKKKLCPLTRWKSNQLFNGQPKTCSSKVCQIGTWPDVNFCHVNVSKLELVYKCQITKLTTANWMSSIFLFEYGGASCVHSNLMLNWANGLRDCETVWLVECLKLSFESSLTWIESTSIEVSTYPWKRFCWHKQHHVYSFSMKSFWNNLRRYRLF